MYEKFFNLKECPFRLPPDPEYLFLSNQHKLALVHLEYGLTHQAGFIVITGEIGTGKTTLLKTMLRRIGNDTLAASIFNTTVGPDEFLNLILDDFELGWADTDTHTLKLEKLKTFLIDAYTAGKKTVLIVDEAQNLGMDTLEEIRLLSNIQTTKDYLIHIFLVGQPELKQKLTHPSLRQLAQRISVHYHINPLSHEETNEYIKHRLKISGAAHVETCFSPEALEEIYSRTKGFPRLINLLCDACLVNAFADQTKPVTRDIVLSTVKGDGAGNFWQIAATREFDNTAGTGTEEADVPPAAGPAADYRLNPLEKRISELEKTVQVISRLVSEKMMDTEPEKIKNIETRKILSQLLDREQKKVVALALENKKLREKINELLRSLEEEQKKNIPTPCNPEQNFFARMLGVRSKNEK